VTEEVLEVSDEGAVDVLVIVEVTSVVVAVSAAARPVLKTPITKKADNDDC
jgi:hypothetical protein